MRVLSGLVFGALLGCSSLVSAGYGEHGEAQKFIDEMVSKHDFSKAELQRVLGQAEKKESILKAISRPAEKRLEWKGYRKIFLTEDRVKKGLAFMKTHAETLKKAEEAFGVPPHIVASIIGVETRYGQNKGSYRVIDALSTLAFDYPPRSKFFRSELEQVLLLAREQGFQPLDLKGSYAGAMGFGQFIPSSYRHYAVDFDGDNVADILNNPIDAIGSVANYFKRHKWVNGQDVAFVTEVKGEAYKDLGGKKLKPVHTLAELKQAGVGVPSDYDMTRDAKLHVLNGASGEEFWVTLHNFYVITRYNHSHLYAMAVYQLSEELRKGFE